MSESPVPDLSAVASPPRQSLSYDDLDVSEEPLGAGGQSIVYEATLTRCEQPTQLVLKEPKYSGTLTDEVRDPFLQEASTWQTIDRREREKPRWNEYEHIVGVIDTGETDAHVPWIAMEYMDGGDLEDRLDTAPDGLPVDEALWIGECLCRGLEIADEYGYSHLDVKPKNILFRQTPEGTWDVPKLADWGVARTLADETGTMAEKTVMYSAPEQFEPSEFGDPDSLTDLYQVGAVVYTMLTGEPPYTGSHTQIMRDVVLGDGLTPPSQHRSALSEAIDVAVTQAMAKHKQDRYRGLQNFERALRAIRTDRRLPEVIATQLEPSATGGHPLSTQKEESPSHTSETDISAEDGHTTWSMFQTDPARTGSPFHATGPTGEVTASWKFETGDSIKSSPAVVDGTVYVGSFNNNLYAVDASTGDKQWAFETGDSVFSSPAVVDGTVYVGSYDNNLYAVDASTGDKQWVFETGNWITSSPAVVDGTVYVGSWDDNLYAVDASTGDKQWAFEIGDRVTGNWVASSPVVVDGTVYVGSSNSNLYAVDAATGEKQWAFETGDSVHSPPAVAEGTVYVGSWDNTVYAVDGATGEKQWAFETGDWVTSSPVVVEDTVYVGSRDDNLYAVDASTGDKQWAFETGDWVTSSPVVVEDTVYVGSFNNNLYAVDASTGDKQWAFETGDSVFSSPAVVDGTVYVGSNDNNLYAVE